MTDIGLSERIRRVFAAACVGDAMGAATEGMHPDEIVAVFGGQVTGLRQPPARAPFALGLAPGRLTDDATQMLVMARKIMRTRGRPTIDDVTEALIEWADDDDVFARFAGPTTRLAVEQLRAGVSPDAVASPPVYSCVFGTSNGGAMRAPAAGCALPGDIAAAARLACRLAAPTHNTQIAYGGAAAVAAAIAAGLGAGRDGTVIEVADRGAAIGEAEAITSGRIVGGAGVRRRIELAGRIGENWRGDLVGAVAELTQIVGNGVAMAEAVPHAFGLVIAADMNPWEAIVAAVNGGNDSDTIALITGSIAAAWWGGDSLPRSIIHEIEVANHIDLTGFSIEFTNTLSGEAA